MARLRAAVTTEGEIALSAATAKTILQLVAAANHKVAVKGFSVSFDGTSVTAEPVQVDLIRQTSAGSGGTAATPYAEDTSSETVQTTAVKGCTSEPTGTTIILRRYDVHPQTGFEVRFNSDDEIVLAGGGRLGIRCTAPATVNALAHFSFEE